jgi:ferredoxin
MVAMKPFFPKKKLNEDLCIKCGTCAEICPVSNIKMNGFPEIKKKCTYCFSCVKHCQKNALTTDLKIFGQMIPVLSKLFARHERLGTEMEFNATMD